MGRMISCLVDRPGRVYAKDGVNSHTMIAEACGVEQDKCLAYEFRLDKRTLFQDFNMDKVPFAARASHDQAAQDFFDQCASTPDKLIAFVLRGNYDYKELTKLLTHEACLAYDKTYDETLVAWKKTCAKALAGYEKTCAKAWAAYTKTCDEAAYDKTCAKARAVYNKTCDEALAAHDKTRVKAWAARAKTCAKAWIKLFQDNKNRIPVWQS